MKDKGYLTIEASVIVPVVLFGVFICLFGLVFIYEKGYVQSSIYEALYTIPLNNIRKDDVVSYLDSEDYSGGIVWGTSKVESKYIFKKAECDGTVDLYGSSSVDGVREVDCLVERLRRWQFYDGFAEEQGHE